MWTLLRQQQQRGVQLPEDKRRPGEPPEDATGDRSAQDHEHAGGEPRPGNYPATRLEDRDGDITPSAPDPDVEWDQVVQPEKAKQVDSGKQPLPEGK